MSSINQLAANRNKVECESDLITGSLKNGCTVRARMWCTYSIRDGLWIYSKGLNENIQYGVDCGCTVQGLECECTVRV